MVQKNKSDQKPKSKSKSKPKTKAKPKNKKPQQPSQSQTQNVTINIPNTKTKKSSTKKSTKKELPIKALPRNEGLQNAAFTRYFTQDNREVDTLRGELVDTKNKLLTFEKNINNDTEIKLLPYEKNTEKKFYSDSDNVGDWHQINKQATNKKFRDDFTLDWKTKNLINERKKQYQQKLINGVLNDIRRTGEIKELKKKVDENKIESSKLNARNKNHEIKRKKSIVDEIKRGEKQNRIDDTLGMMENDKYYQNQDMIDMNIFKSAKIDRKHKKTTKDQQNFEFVNFGDEPATESKNNFADFNNESNNFA